MKIFTVIIAFAFAGLVKPLQFGPIDTCSKRAALKPVTKIKLLEPMQLKIALNLSMLNEVYDDMYRSYELATKEIERVLTSDAEFLKPDYEGLDKYYYILADKFNADDSEIACWNRNLRPVTIERNVDITGLLEFLKDYKGISKIVAPTMARGDNVYNLQGDLLAQIDMQTEIPTKGDEALGDDDQIIKRGPYNEYPSYISLNTDGVTFDIEPGTHDKHEDPVDVVCESDKTARHSHESEEYGMLRNKLETIIKLGPKFVKTLQTFQELGDRPIETLKSVTTPGYNIYPDNVALQIRENLRILKSRLAWDRGEITNHMTDQTITLMKKSIKNFLGRDGFVKLKVANVNKIKEQLNVEYVDKALFIKPLKKSLVRKQSQILAIVKGLVHKPETNVAEIYRILPNIVEGKAIADRFLTRIGHETMFTTKNYPFPKLDCHYGPHREYCLPNLGASTISQGSSCARELIDKESKDPTTCRLEDNTKCVAYYANCGNKAQNAIISCYNFAKIDVFCEGSKLGTINAREGLTKIKTKNVVLKHNEKIILAEDYKSNATDLECTMPKGVLDDGRSQRNIMIGSITSAVVIVGGLIGTILVGVLRKVYNRSFFCCTCCCGKKKSNKSQRSMSVNSIPGSNFVITKGKLQQNSFENSQNENIELGTLMEKEEKGRNRSNSLTFSIKSKIENHANCYMMAHAPRFLEHARDIMQGHSKPERTMYAEHKANAPKYDQLPGAGEFQVTADVSRADE